MRTIQVLRQQLVFFACAAVAAVGLGCTESAGEQSESTYDEATSCVIVRSGAAWWNQAIPEQTGRFHVELTATPSASNIDAVVGLSSGAATTWTKLAAIARFSPAGIIDVRSGGTYRYDTRFAYTAGQTYWLRFDVDVTRRTYSVWVKTYALGEYVALARDYSFRNEQSTITKLSNVASYLEPSRTGTFQLCEVNVVADDTTADGCIVGNAGATFANAQLTSTSTTLVATFNASPSQANMDGVVGFANGRVDDYNDFAASIRFAANGMIEARDGDRYRADQAVPYRAGEKFRFRLVVDVPSKTYSVFVGYAGQPEETHLARSYRFRPQQANVTALDHGATVVASAAGSVSACGFANRAHADIAFARDGVFNFAALPIGDVVIADANTTRRIDSAGGTAGEIAFGGHVATDAAGNIFIAQQTPNGIALRTYNARFEAAWGADINVELTGTVHSVGAFSSTEVGVVIRDQGAIATLLVLRSDGSWSSLNLMQFNVQAIAIGPGRFAMVHKIGTGDGFVIDVLAPNGLRLWQRSWSGRMYADVMAIDDQSGILVAGWFDGPIDFGDGVHEPIFTEEGSRNTFALALAHNGSLRFSRRLYTSFATGIAGSAGRVVVSAQDWTQFPHPLIRLYDSAGREVWGLGGSAVDDFGFPGAVAIGPSGRVFTTISYRYMPHAIAPAWPFMMAFDP